MAPGPRDRFDGLHAVPQIKGEGLELPAQQGSEHTASLALPRAPTGQPAQAAGPHINAVPSFNN